MLTIEKMDGASLLQRSRSAIEISLCSRYETIQLLMSLPAPQVLLDDNSMRAIVAEVCDGDLKAANVLCRVSAC